MMQSDYERKLAERRRKLDARRGMLLHDDDATSTCNSYQYQNDAETVASSISQQIRLENQLRKRQEVQERRMRRLQAFRDTQPRKHLDDDATTVTEASTVASSVTEIRKTPNLEKKADTRRTRMYIPRLSPGAQTAPLDATLGQAQGGTWGVKSFTSRVSDSVNKSVVDWRLKIGNNMQSLVTKAKDFAYPVVVACGKLVLVVVYVVVLAFSESLYIRLGLLVIGLDMRSESPYCEKLAGRAFKYYFVKTPVEEAPRRHPQESVEGLLQKTRQKIVQEVHQEPLETMEIELETAISQPEPPKVENNVLSRIWLPSYLGLFDVAMEYASEDYTPRFMKPSTLLRDVMTSWGWRKIATIPVIVSEEDLREYVGAKRPTLAILSEQMVKALAFKTMQPVGEGIRELCHEAIVAEEKSNKQTIKATTVISGWLILMIFSANNIVGSIVAVAILCIYTSTAYPGVRSFLEKLSCALPSAVHMVYSESSQIKSKRLKIFPQSRAIYRNKEYNFSEVLLTLLEEAMGHSSRVWFRNAGALTRDSLDLMVSIPLLVCSQKIEVSCPVVTVDTTSSEDVSLTKNVQPQSHRYNDYGIGDLLAQVCHTSRSISEHDRLELARMSQRILDLKRSSRTPHTSLQLPELGSEGILALEAQAEDDESLISPMLSQTSSIENTEDTQTLEEQEVFEDLLDTPWLEQDSSSESDKNVHVQTLDSDDEESFSALFPELEVSIEFEEATCIEEVQHELTSNVSMFGQDSAAEFDDVEQSFEVEENELTNNSLSNRSDAAGAIQTATCEVSVIHDDSSIIPLSLQDVPLETRDLVLKQKVEPEALLPLQHKFTMIGTKKYSFPRLRFSIQCPSNSSRQQDICRYTVGNSLCSELTAKNVNKLLTFIQQNSQNNSSISAMQRSLEVLPSMRKHVSCDDNCNQSLMPFESPTSFRVAVTTQLSRTGGIHMLTCATYFKDNQMQLKLLFQNGESPAFGRIQCSAQLAAIEAMTSARTLKVLPAITTSEPVIKEVPPNHIASAAGNYTFATPLGTTVREIPSGLRVFKDCRKFPVPVVCKGNSQNQALQLQWSPMPTLRDPLERQILEYVFRRSVFLAHARTVTKARSHLPVVKDRTKGSKSAPECTNQETNIKSPSGQVGQLLSLKPSTFQPMSLQMQPQPSKLDLFNVTLGEVNFLESKVALPLVRMLTIERPLNAPRGMVTRNSVPSSVNSVIANAWSTSTVGVFTMFHGAYSRPMLALGSACVIGLTAHSLASDTLLTASSFAKTLTSANTAAHFSATQSEFEASLPAMTENEIEFNSHRDEIDNTTLIFVCFYILMNTCDDAISVTFILIPLGYHLGTGLHLHCDMNEDIKSWQIQFCVDILTSLVPCHRRDIVSKKTVTNQRINQRISQPDRRSLLRHVASSINLDKGHVLELPEEPVTCYKTDQHTFSFGGFTTTFAQLPEIQEGEHSASKGIEYNLAGFSDVESFIVLQPCSDDIQYLEAALSESVEVDDIIQCVSSEDICQVEEVEDIRCEEEVDCRQDFQEECRDEMEDRCEPEGSDEREDVEACDDKSHDKTQRSIEQCPSDETMEEEEVYVHVKAKPSKKTLYNQLSVGAVFAAGVGASLVLGMKRR